MEMLILLYFAYAIYRAGLDAAVRGYALAKGRDVTIGEGDRKRHYAGWTLGAALAVFGRSLWEGWRVAWPWARDMADAARARRAARRDGRELDDEWDDLPPETVDDDTNDGDGEADDESPFRCVRCGRDLHGIGIAARPTPEGWACGEHFRDYCAACGNPPRDGDPLVLDEGAWLHLSHLTPDDPLTPDDDRPAAGEDTPAGGEPAEVIDEATGQPVDAAWEDAPATAPLPAASWTKVHNPTP